MKRTIYENNQSVIDNNLRSRGYVPSYENFLKAVDDLGNPFLLAIYTEISSRWSNADGSGWDKFKKIFSKSTDVAEKIVSGANIADGFLNPGTTPDNSSYKPAPEKKKWQPNIMLWAGVASFIIIILVIIYLFKS